jgi:hypothetical protein
MDQTPHWIANSLNPVSEVNLDHNYMCPKKEQKGLVNQDSPAILQGPHPVAKDHTVIMDHAYDATDKSAGMGMPGNWTTLVSVAKGKNVNRIFSKNVNH